MHGSRLPRRTAWLLAFVILISIPAHGAPRQGARRAGPAAQPSLAVSVMQFLASVWSAGRATVDPWGAPSDGRAGLDPSGTPTAATSEGRGVLDPDGVVPPPPGAATPEAAGTTSQTSVPGR